MRLRNKEIGPPSPEQPPPTPVLAEQPSTTTPDGEAPTLEHPLPTTTSASQMPTLEPPSPTTAVDTSNLKPPPVVEAPPSSRNDSLIPFANDPVRGPPLTVPTQEVEALNGPNFLNTSLIDYLIQQAAPTDLPDDVLIGSSNAMSYFDLMNKKNSSYLC